VCECVFVCMWLCVCLSMSLCVCMCVYAVDYKTLEQKLTANQLGRCLQLLWLVGSFQVLLCKRGVWVGVWCVVMPKEHKEASEYRARARERETCVWTHVPISSPMHARPCLASTNFTPSR